MKSGALLAFAIFLASLVFAQSYPGANDSLPAGEGAPPNDPPVWNTTPAPTFVEGIVSSYDVSQHFSDPEGDTITFTNEAGCTLPIGQSVDDANDELDEDGTSPAATTTSCVFGIDDGTNARVDSDAFPIVVTALPALGTIYERDMFGTPRTGTSGAVETLGPHTGNPIAELNDVVPIDISDYTCDATVTTGDGDWTKVNDSGNIIVCIAAGDHSAKGELEVTDGGSAGTSRTISAVTLNNPVRVDFTAAHGWTTNDIIHFDDAVGDTWQLRWRYFRVTVIDSDTVDLQNQDGTGIGLRPAWTTYTSGGTAQRPNFKIIRHAVDITSHPSVLASGDRAKLIRLRLGTNATPLDRVMVIGLTLDHKGLAASIGGNGNDIYGGDYIIIDQVHDYNEEALADIEADFQQDGFQLLDSSDNTVRFVQIQRSVFGERGIDGSGTDSFYMNIAANNADAVHFIKNETASAMSSWQKQEQGGLYNFLYAENTDYLTTLVYTDCAGNLVGGSTFGASDSSPCAVAESAGAFKGSSDVADGRIIATAANRHLINVIDANVQCCRRSEDGVLSDGGSGGQSYGFSNPGGNNTIRNVMFRNNIAFANENGVPEGVTHGSLSLTTEYVSVVGNLNVDLSDTGISWFSHAQVTTQNLEFLFNSFVNMPQWISLRRMKSTTYECNLHIDAGSRAGAQEGTFTQKNNYGYGNTVDMDGTGDNDGGAVSNANMADLVVNPKQWSDPSFEFTLSGVLSTASSPHLGDCPSVGTSGRGVTDATVTF